MEKKFTTLFDDAEKSGTIKPLSPRELQLAQGKNFVFKNVKKLFVAYERFKKVFLYIEPVFRLLAYAYLAYQFFT